MEINIVQNDISDNFYSDYKAVQFAFSILGENIKKNLGFSHFLCHFCKIYLIFHCSRIIFKLYLNSTEKKLSFGIKVCIPKCSRFLFFSKNTQGKLIETLLSRIRDGMRKSWTRN